MKSQIFSLQSIATSSGLAIFISALGLAAVPVAFPVPARAEVTELASKRVPLAEMKHGRTTLPSFVRVLSFDELMRLSKGKRTAYVRGLRQLMIEIDRAPQTAKVGEVQRSQIATLLALFETQALAASSPGLPALDEAGDKVTCGSGFYPVHPRTLPGNAADTDPSHYLCSVRAARSANACPGDSIPVNQDSQTTAFYCATKSSFDRMLKESPMGASNARAVRASLIGATAATLGMKNFTDPKYITQDAIQKKTGTARTNAKARSQDALSFKYPAGIKAPSAPAEGTATIPGRLSADTPKTTSLVAGEGGVQKPAGKPIHEESNPAPPPPPPDQPGTPKALPQPAPTGPVREEKGRPQTETSSSESTDVVVAPVKTATEACQPESETPKTCNPSEIEAARRKYASDPDQDCIYAGGISTYEGGTKRAYHCQAPRTFCFGSSSCLSETGEKLKPDYSCAVSQVICNPLLFGVQSDGRSPFCIPRGARATSACDEASGDDAVSPLDQKHAGLREAWNDFADRLFTMCHANQTAAALHCAECDIISKRLFAMNLAARDVKSCGAALKYEASNCDASGVCSVRPGGGDPDARSKAAPVRGSKGTAGTASTLEPESVWDQRAPASSPSK